MWSWVCRSCCWSSQVVWPKIHPTLPLKRLSTSINIFIWEVVAGSTDAVGFIQKKYLRAIFTPVHDMQSWILPQKSRRASTLQMLLRCSSRAPLDHWCFGSRTQTCHHCDISHWLMKPGRFCLNILFFFWDQIRWTIIIIIYWGYRGRCQQCNTDAFCEVLLLLRAVVSTDSKWCRRFKLGLYFPHPQLG